MSSAGLGSWKDMTFPSPIIRPNGCQLGSSSEFLYSTSYSTPAWVGIERLTECAAALSPEIIPGSGWITVTSNEQVLALPVASVTAQVTVVVPRGKTPPGGVEYSTMRFMSPRSENCTWKGNSAPSGWVLRTETFAGQMICGACVSATVTVKMLSLVLPRASQAVHRT